MYRFDHPRVYPDIINDMYIRASEPGPGDRVDPFVLYTLDGAALHSADLVADGRPLLLVFGSLTCPVTEHAGEGLHRLYATHGEQVRFVLIQVREAHPGGTIPQPHTLAEKLRHGAALKRHHQLPFDVAVDDIDGTFHRRLGARPNSAYVIDANHTIVFRAQWANETAAIDEALAAIAGGRRPPHPSVTRTLHAASQMIGYMSPVLDAAGKGARLDTWKVAPPLGLMMSVADALVFLPRHRRGLPAMLLTMAAAAVALAGLLSAV